MSRSTTNRHAFTLVELLVVIGIIALLVSILLPTLSSARRSAQSTVCLSNVRQLMQATLFYVNDNNGSLPYSYSPSNELVNRTIRIAMDENFEGSAIAETYHCPSRTLEVEDTFSVTYGVNMATFVFSPDYVVPPRPTKRLSSIRRSTEIFAFADANQTKVDASGSPNGGSQEFIDQTDWNFPNAQGFIHQPLTEADRTPDTPVPNVNNIDRPNLPTDYQATAIRYRHGRANDIDSGSASVVFHDGHAELLEVGQIQQRHVAITY